MDQFTSNNYSGHPTGALRLSTSSITTATTTTTNTTTTTAVIKELLCVPGSMDNDNSAPFSDFYSSDYYNSQEELLEAQFENEENEENQETSTLLNSPKVLKTLPKRLPWSKEEDEKLIKIVEIDGTKQWHRVALKMGTGRDKNQVRSRFHQYLKKKGNESVNLKNIHWNEEDDIKLFKLVELHGNSWNKISKLMGNRTNIQCCNRFNYKKANSTQSKNVRWSKEEDSELLSLVKKYGTSDWFYISSKISTDRCRVQCCNRYNGYLKYDGHPNETLEIDNASLPVPASAPVSLPTLLPVSLPLYLPIEDSSLFNTPTFEPSSYQLLAILESIQNQVNYYNSLYTPNIILNKD